MEVAVKNPESKLEVLREVRGAKLEVLPYCSRCVSTDIPGYLENGVHHHVHCCLHLLPRAVQLPAYLSPSSSFN